jgi:TorA maturation chaperone TorD
VRRDKGHVLADVAGFYTAFGLERNPHRQEKLDHLPTELEFLALLLVLQAQAVAEGQDEAGLTTAAAVRSFAADHVGEYLPAVADRLTAATHEPFFAKLAATLVRFWNGFCERRGVVAAPVPAMAAAVAAASVAIDEEPGFACGGCGEAPTF